MPRHSQFYKESRTRVCSCTPPVPFCRSSSSRTYKRVHIHTRAGSLVDWKGKKRWIERAKGRRLRVAEEMSLLKRQKRASSTHHGHQRDKTKWNPTAARRQPASRLSSLPPVPPPRPRFFIHSPFLAPTSCYRRLRHVFSPPPCLFCTLRYFTSASSHPPLTPLSPSVSLFVYRWGASRKRTRKGRHSIAEEGTQTLCDWRTKGTRSVMFLSQSLLPPPTLLCHTVLNVIF